MGSGRILYLDIIRIVACVMVVIQHSPMPQIGTPGIVLSACSFLTYPAIGLFFMVSGALLLPVEMSSIRFYKRRLSKVIYPTLFWSMIYILFRFVKYNLSAKYVLTSICLLPVAPQGTPVFWFVYVLIGLYLFAPILSPWIERASKRDIQSYLLLWSVTLLFPIVQGYLKIPYEYYSVLCYFGGYLGYFVLGYYLHRFYERPMRLEYSFLFILIPIIAYAICKKINMKSDFNTYYYLSLFSAMMVVGWFTLFQHLRCLKLDDSSRWQKNVILLSNCTFGIYLVHILVMREGLWTSELISAYGSVFQIVATSALTFVISFAITFFISKLPYSRYLVGF